MTKIATILTAALVLTAALSPALYADALLA